MDSKIRNVTLGLFMMAVAAASGVTILESNFEATDEGWTATPGVGTPNAAVNYPIAGNPGSAIQLSGDGGVLNVAYFSASTASFLAGGNADFLNDYGDPLRSLRFDFYVTPSIANGPAGLEAYFVSGAQEWTYDLSAAVSGISTPGWTHFNLNFYATDVGDVVGAGNGWEYIDGGLTDQGSLLAALGDVDEIGLILTFGSDEGAGQIYALDNFNLDNEYFVPEPGTWAALGFAFVSLGFTFRRKISDKVKEFRS